MSGQPSDLDSFDPDLQAIPPDQDYRDLYHLAQQQEARIKELEAENESFRAACARDRMQLLGELTALKARLEKAEALAEAVEEADAVYGNFERELTAYREAGK